MNILVRKPIIPWICVTLFLIQSGCATSPRVAAPPSTDTQKTRVTSPPSDDIRKNLGTIGIVSVQSAPKVRFLAPTREKGAGAAAGRTAGRALGGLWAGCGQVILATAETIIIPILAWHGCVAVTPFVAGGGALIGGSGSDAAKANRATKAKHKAKLKELRPVIDSALAAVTTDTPLQPRLLEQAQNRTDRAFVDVTGRDPKAFHERESYSGLTNEGIDTVLEATMWRLEVTPDHAFVVTAKARLIRLMDDAELYAGTYTFRTDARAISAWTADGGKQVAAALMNAYQSLAERIVDDIFPLPIAQLESDDDKELADDANDDKDESKSTMGKVISISKLRPESPRLERLAIYNDASTRLDGPVVESLQPTLRWEVFVDRQSLGVDTGERLARVDQVTYEIRIARTESGLPFDVIVSETGLTRPSYTLAQPLKPATVYWWTVRARYRLDGKPQVTAWSSVVSTDDASNAPQATRQSVNVPNAFSYRFETLALDVETPSLAVVEEHVGSSDVGDVVDYIPLPRSANSQDGLYVM